MPVPCSKQTTANLASIITQTGCRAESPATARPALTAATNIRATADSEWPDYISRTARRRSSSAALPSGLMYPAWNNRVFPSIIYLSEAQ